jgi:hypothetical protein
MSDKILHSDPALELQLGFSKTLGLGVALSIYPILGFGAFLIGLKSARTISISGSKLYCLAIVWWCIIVGALESALTLYMIVSGLRGTIH